MCIDLTIDFDFDAFEAEVYEAAHVVFAKLQRDYSNETFYTFNFCVGDVMQNVYIIVNTEQELERFARGALPNDDRYLDVPFEDFRTYWRYQMPSYMGIDGKSDSEFAKRFAKANDMLWSLNEAINDLEDDLLESEKMDEDDIFDYLYENFYEPISDRLARVLQRLDKEGAFELTNRRENIHLGVLESTWFDDDLPGPFLELNPPQSCRKYEEDEVIYKRVRVTIYGYPDG